MTTTTDKALLPAGLTDGLAPQAAHEADIRERLIAAFTRHGFDRVSPPLVEFEDHLLAGTGAAMAAQTFRLMDPVSQRMMGLRADITPQAARIASSRLDHVARPLRLCYAGEVLRVRGSQLRPERQFTQAGAELIGAPEAAADAEMILMAVEALNAIGIADIKVDLCQPTLVPLVMRDLGLADADAVRFRLALDRKDAAEVAALSQELGTDAQGILRHLLAASGPVETVSGRLARLQMGVEAAAARDALLEVVHLIQSADPALDLTLDAVENRGFEYHTGVTFTLFAPGVRGELGTGGRYRAGHINTDGEPATGFTLFLDSILRAVDAPASAPLVFLPMGTPRTVAAALHADGFRTRFGHADVENIEAEALRIGCSHVLKDGKPLAIRRA